MPQMAPMNWLFLMLMLLIIFLIFKIHNFYFFLPKIQTSLFKEKKINYSWLW